MKYSTLFDYFDAHDFDLGFKTQSDIDGAACKPAQKVEVEKQTS
jgi:hypothetical protein